MYVNPSTSFEAVAQFETGLTGTLGVRIIDNAGNTTLARATAGIAEYPSGSGIYAVTLTSPGTAGQYTLVWDNGAADPAYATEDLTVVAEVADVVIGSGNLYVTPDDLDDFDAFTGDGGLKDAAKTIACQTASRAIDAYKGTRYYAVSETRYYTARTSYDREIQTDDLVSASTVALDRDGDRVWEETLVEGTDYALDPINAPLDGRPYSQITLLPNAGISLPMQPHGIKVVASFGWSAAPQQVQAAALLYANRFLARVGEAPLGILVAQATEAVATARLSRIDPDLAFLLDEFPNRKRTSASIRLN